MPTHANWTTSGAFRVDSNAKVHVPRQINIGPTSANESPLDVVVSPSAGNGDPVNYYADYSGYGIAAKFSSNVANKRVGITLSARG